MEEEYRTVIDSKHENPINLTDFQISNYGNVKRVISGNKKTIDKPLKSYLKNVNDNDPNNHIPTISFSIRNKNHKRSIHDLIAKAFIPNPDNKPNVLHIDHNSRNNIVTNLIWANFHETRVQQPFVERSNTIHILRLDKETGKTLQEHSSLDKSIKWIKAETLVKKLSRERMLRICKNEEELAGFIWALDKSNEQSIKDEVWTDIDNHMLDLYDNVQNKSAEKIVYGYISNMGRIKYLTDRIKRLREDDGKLYYVVGYNNKTYRIHKLVLFAFDPNNYKPGLVANHKNNDQHDNRLENLEWATIQENTQHAVNIGATNGYNKQPVALYKMTAGKMSDLPIRNFDSHADLITYIYDTDKITVSPANITSCASGNTNTICSRKYKVVKIKQ